MKYFRLVKTFACLSLIIATLYVGFTFTASASTINWAGTNPTLVSSQSSNSVNGWFCSQPWEGYENGVVVEGISGSQSACTSQGESIKFGITVSSGNYTVVSYPNEQKMYVVLNLGCSSAQPCTYIPARDTLVSSRRVNNNAYNGSQFTVYKNFTSRLSVASSSSFEHAYNFNFSNPDYVLRSATENLHAYTYSISPSGRWVTLPVVGKGLFRHDLESSTLLKYSNDRPTFELGSRQHYQDSITNDGAHILVAGMNVSPKIYDIGECGVQLTTSHSGQQFYNDITNPCPSLRLSNRPDLTTMTSLRAIYDPKFSKDGGEVEFTAQSQQYATNRVVLRAASYEPPYRLDYLAMGDSYSSGEGDIERRPTGLKYYLPGTDVKGDYANGIPEEKCHISARSYPYKLMQDMNATGKSAKSIACSGARINDMDAPSYYQGQFAGIIQGPRLSGLSNIDELQEQGMREFMPGRVEQIEFMGLHHPAIATMMIGGNDLDFDKKLKECVLNSVIANCSLVTEKGRAQLGKEIKALYPKLKDLYRKMKVSSRETQFYVLGYPQFVSRQFNNCAMNVTLSPSERVMINEAVSYANNVIKAAANDSGMKYIDIEDSLNGHALCDLGESYVTGVSGYGLTTEAQEMFHPNAKGHEAIYNKIKEGLGSSNLKNATHCNQIIVCPTGAQQGAPTAPSYFAPAMSLYDQLFTAYTMVKEGIEATATSGMVALKKGVNWVAEVAPMAAQPITSVRFELNSNPVDLGTFTTGADGSVSATLTIPASVPAGIHTLRMYGQTFSGEQIEYYQIVEVQGADGDIDEDSVPDAQDACIYINAANVDSDFDGVDDACDPEISGDPQIYRVRNGDTTKGEVPLGLYIERNTRASSVTGITNDDDPDGDGWALVAASQNTGEEGKVANFWVDNSDVPHVSIRTAENGCMQFTPATLSVVLPGAIRTLNTEASNTNTCRAELATDDADGNGQPDNEQALYRARNGIASQGEDSSKLYVERNTRAAEAQLGISDYASTGDLASPNGDTRSHWSIIASSQEPGTQGVYNKLLMPSGNPVILARDSNNQCIALQPTVVTNIKQSTQLLRPLVLTSAPQGEDCDS